MDIRRYIGIPFLDHGCGLDGCDCYGLVRLVYRHELGIILPCLGGGYSDALARAEVAETVRKARGWAVDVSGRPFRPLDVLVFRRGGLESHVGLWVRENTMLHVMESVDACLEPFNTSRWSRMYARTLRHESFC